MDGRSEYMEWAKTRSQARFNLASSGIVAFPLAELPVRLDALELTGPSFYGYPPLLARLARKCGVAEDCVLPATGTSMANFLVMAALLEPGDHVLVEQPTYGPLVDAARFLRADLRRFPRRAEEEFRLDPAAVEAAITTRTRLVVVTNPHNPSSAIAGEDTMRRVGEIARAAGARLLVDEVYLEASSILGRPRPSSFGLGPEIVVTSSLTKAYGLGGLRCGWALAEPDLVRRMWRLNDLMGVVPAHPAELLSIKALDHLDLAADHARHILLANREAVNAFLDSRNDLRAPRVAEGMLVFPKVLGKDVDALVRVLRERHETSVVPGRFFDTHDHVRISVGAPPEIVAGGLARLGEALDSLPAVERV
jgi:aspartate/methionine/tyrosine aminotransferase